MYTQKQQRHTMDNLRALRFSTWCHIVIVIMVCFTLPVSSQNGSEAVPMEDAFSPSSSSSSEMRSSSSSLSFFVSEPEVLLPSEDIFAGMGASSQDSLGSSSYFTESSATDNQQPDNTASVTTVLPVSTPLLVTSSSLLVHNTSSNTLNTGVTSTLTQPSSSSHVAFESTPDVISNTISTSSNHGSYVSLTSDRPVSNMLVLSESISLELSTGLISEDMFSSSVDTSLTLNLVSSVLTELVSVQPSREVTDLNPELSESITLRMSSSVYESPQSTIFEMTSTEASDGNLADFSSIAPTPTTKSDVLHPSVIASSDSSNFEQSSNLTVLSDTLLLESNTQTTSIESSLAINSESGMSENIEISSSSMSILPIHTNSVTVTHSNAVESSMKISTSEFLFNETSSTYLSDIASSPIDLQTETLAVETVKESSSLPIYITEETKPLISSVLTSIRSSLVDLTAQDSHSTSMELTSSAVDIASSMESQDSGSSIVSSSPLSIIPDLSQESSNGVGQTGAFSLDNSNVLPSTKSEVRSVISSSSKSQETIAVSSQTMSIVSSVTEITQGSTPSSSLMTSNGITFSHSEESPTINQSEVSAISKTDVSASTSHASEEISITEPSEIVSNIIFTTEKTPSFVITLTTSVMFMSDSENLSQITSFRPYTESIQLSSDELKSSTTSTASGSHNVSMPTESEHVSQSVSFTFETSRVSYTSEFDPAFSDLHTNLFSDSFGDTDVVVTQTGQLSEMFSSKQVNETTPAHTDVPISPTLPLTTDDITSDMFSQESPIPSLSPVVSRSSEDSLVFSTDLETFISSDLTIETSDISGTMLSTESTAPFTDTVNVMSSELDSLTVPSLAITDSMTSDVTTITSDMTDSLITSLSVSQIVPSSSTLSFSDSVSMNSTLAATYSESSELSSSEFPSESGYTTTTLSVPFSDVADTGSMLQSDLISSVPNVSQTTYISTSMEPGFTSFVPSQGSISDLSLPSESVRISVPSLMSSSDFTLSSDVIMSSAFTQSDLFSSERLPTTTIYNDTYTPITAELSESYFISVPSSEMIQSSENQPSSLNHSYTQTERVSLSQTSDLSPASSVFVSTASSLTDIQVNSSVYVSWTYDVSSPAISTMTSVYSSDTDNTVSTSDTLLTVTPLTSIVLLDSSIQVSFLSPSSSEDFASDGSVHSSLLLTDLSTVPLPVTTSFFQSETILMPSIGSVISTESFLPSTPYNDTSMLSSDTVTHSLLSSLTDLISPTVPLSSPDSVVTETKSTIPSSDSSVILTSSHAYNSSITTMSTVSQSFNVNVTSGFSSLYDSVSFTVPLTSSMHFYPSLNPSETDTIFVSSPGITESLLTSDVFSTTVHPSTVTEQFTPTVSMSVTETASSILPSTVTSINYTTDMPVSSETSVQNMTSSEQVPIVPSITFTPSFVESSTVVVVSSVSDTLLFSSFKSSDIFSLSVISSMFHNETVILNISSIVETSPGLSSMFITTIDTYSTIATSLETSNITTSFIDLSIVIPTVEVVSTLHVTSSVLFSSSDIIPTNSTSFDVSPSIEASSDLVNTSDILTTMASSMDAILSTIVSTPVYVSTTESLSLPSEIISTLGTSSSEVESTSNSLSIQSQLSDIFSTLEISGSSVMSTSESLSLPPVSSDIVPTLEISSSLVMPSSHMLSSFETSLSTVVSTSESLLLPSLSSEILSMLETPSSIDVSATENVSMPSPSSEVMSTLDVPSSVIISTSVILPTSVSEEFITSTSVSVDVVTSSLLNDSSVVATSDFAPTPTSSDVTAPSSSLTPTTTSTIQPTVPTTTAAVPSNLLVITVIRLQNQDDIQSQTFWTEMEEGLARAYDQAFERQANSGSSSFRRKRFVALLHFVSHQESVAPRTKRAVVNNVEVKMRDVRSQAEDPQNAELTYTVDHSGQAVSATEATQALDGLMDQELALHLDRVVITKATPADGTATTTTGGDDQQLWIIGAVLGPVVLLAVVWVVVCVAVRHRSGKKDKVTINDQPHLLTVKHADTTRESEVADDPEYATPGQSNGLVKSSPHKMKYEVTTDPDTTATSTGREDSSTRMSKKGRKLPKKKGSPPETSDMGETSSEQVTEKSSPSKKKNVKKSSFRDTEGMEMSHLDPGFYNTATLEASRQLYAQQTFEDEDEEFVESMEEERRKNKQRQRMKKKHAGISATTQPPLADTAELAYERAQKEIDKVLGPRQANGSPTVPGVVVGDTHKRSRRRSRRGEVNEGYKDDVESPRPVLQPSESLEEVKSRVHALLDDAFSLLSNSYTSIGSAVSERSRSFKRNKVAPASPSKREMAEQETEVTQAKLAPEDHKLREVEEARGDAGFAPKPGEKLHTPVDVDRTYGDYDSSGLITWSPYRASDESARIVLPETQVSSIKAPAQEKTQTTTFMESASNRSGVNYYATQPGQPIVIRTRQLTSLAPPRPKPQSPRTRQDKEVEKESPQFGAMDESEDPYLPYPGLETYEEILNENTSTSHFSTVSGESLTDKKPPVSGGGGNDDTSGPTKHVPPTRNVGSRDERDFITSSLGTGTSPKHLVDSIRQELQSLSGKVTSTESTTTSRHKTPAQSSNAHSSVHKPLAESSTHSLQKPPPEKSQGSVRKPRIDSAADSLYKPLSESINLNVNPPADSRPTQSSEKASVEADGSKLTAKLNKATEDSNGHENLRPLERKPLKKPRRASYLDSY